MKIDNIRRATLSDIENMSIVVDECWMGLFRNIFNPAQYSENTGERRRRKFRKLFESRCDVFVTEVDGKIAGVCAAQHLGDIAQIMLIYISPDKQRQKRGKNLLSHTMREMRKKGCKMIILEMPKQITGAKKFFQRMNFVEDTSTVKVEGGITYITYTLEM